MFEKIKTIFGGENQDKSEKTNELPDLEFLQSLNAENFESERDKHGVAIVVKFRYGSGELDTENWELVHIGKDNQATVQKFSKAGGYEKRTVPFVDLKEWNMPGAGN